MTRIIAIAFITVFATNTAAYAWGKTSYYSYDEDRSASYTAKSNDRPAD